MKRWLAVMLALVLLFGCAPAAAASEPAEESKRARSVPARTAWREPQDPGEPGTPDNPEEPEPAGFTDIAGHWAEAEILLAQELGLMNGMTPTSFAPNATMTRGMFVTVLYRLHQALGGAAEPAGESGFADVPAGAYYAEAVAWASAKSIVQGVSPTQFSPNALCTREQAVVLLYRYVGWQGGDCSAAQYLGYYTDATSVSQYARRAVCWAVGVGLLNGVGPQKLAPRESMTRAQLAAMSIRLRSYLNGELAQPAQIPMPAPERSTTLLWFDGQKLSASYTWNGARYLELSELAIKCGGTFAETEGESSMRTAVLTLFGHSFRFCDCFQDVNIDGTRIYWTCPPVCRDGKWYAPVDKLNDALGLHRLEDPQWNEVFYTRIVRNSELPQGCRVPVLMYHAVSDDTWGIAELFVSPASMEAQIKALLNAGYTPITFEDLDHVDLIAKPVLLTFDDGYRDNYTSLFPLLKKYQVKATVFLIGRMTGADKYLTIDQIREMQASGLVSFQSHTMSHSNLDELNATQLHGEMADSRMAIARLTGREPFVLCYPSGRANALAKQIAAQYYQFGLHMTGSAFVTGSTPPFGIYRYYISRYTDLSTFLAYLRG